MRPADYLEMTSVCQWPPTMGLFFSLPTRWNYFRLTFSDKIINIIAYDISDAIHLIRLIFV
jgi:hypothetical protein